MTSSSSAAKGKFTVPATITCEDEKVEYSIGAADRTTLNFGFDSSTRKAHVKLCVGVALKGRAKKTHLYLFVYPEHILNFNVEATTTTIASAIIENTTDPPLKIHLTLSQPALLVSPPGLSPKSANAAETLDKLKTLARVKCFTLGLPSASEDKCAVFRAFAALLLRSDRGGIEASAHEYRTERLYNGTGGVIVDVPAPNFLSSSNDDDGSYDNEQEENAEEEGTGEEEEDASDDDACEKEDGEERNESTEEEVAGEKDEDNGDEQQQHANVPPFYGDAVESMGKKRKQSGRTPLLSAPAKKRGRHGVSGLMSSRKEKQPTAGDPALERNKTRKHNVLSSALEDRRKALEAELKAVCEQLSAEQPPPSYQPPISHKQSREKKLQPARTSNSSFDDRVLTPRGITITYPKTAVSPFTHFGTDPPPPDARLAFYRSKPGLQGTNVWLDGENPSIEELLEEYQILRIYEDNESEYSHYAIEALLKRERRRSQPAYSRPWRCERKLEYTTKPGHLWEKPPLLVHNPDSDYNFHIRPDCSYWISLEAFSGEYSDNVQNFVHVSQNRFLCPYFSIEFKKNEKTESQAESQVAVASAIALYNRYKLKCDHIEHTTSRWTSEYIATLRHYGLVMAGRSYKFFCTTAELDDRHSWKGCKIERLFQSTFDRPQTVPHFVNWINEIHLWGLTVHGPGCEDDIKHCIQRADKGIRVSL